MRPQAFVSGTASAPPTSGGDRYCLAERNANIPAERNANIPAERNANIPAERNANILPAAAPDWPPSPRTRKAAPLIVAARASK